MLNENKRAVIAVLRRDVARLERSALGLPEAGPAPLGFGAPDVDAALGGGLARGAVHDVLAAAEGDAGAVLGFALGLAARLDGPVLLVEDGLSRGEQGLAHGPGLAAMGLDPARLLFVRSRDARELLLAAEEGAECRALCAVIAVLRGGAKAYDLTASRRLALAAARSGVTLFVLLPGLREGVPTAAATRWRIAAAPSPRPGLWAGGVGPPAFDADLLRRRAGPPLSFRLVWSAHEYAFASLPLSRDRPAAPSRGTGPAVAAHERIAAA
jgi:protein ImuA